MHLCYLRNAHLPLRKSQNDFFSLWLFKVYVFVLKSHFVTKIYHLGKVIGESVLRERSYDLRTNNILYKRECGDQKTIVTQIYFTNT